MDDRYDNKLEEIINKLYEIENDISNIKEKMLEWNKIIWLAVIAVVILIFRLW